MSARFSFSRAIVWMAALLLLALPFVKVHSAPEEPGFPSSSEKILNGYGLFNEFQVSTPITPEDPDRYHPESAIDPENGRMLVVWHQTYPAGHDREVIGQLMNLNGTKYGQPIVISSGSHDRVQPVVAYSRTSQTYMVAFMYDVNGDGKAYDIRAQRISSSGALLGGNFNIMSWTLRSFWSPRIAWNSYWDEFMIIWATLYEDTQIAKDISMKAFSPAGFEQRLYNITFDGFPTNPDIAFDPVNHKYLVVWNYVNTSGKNVIRGSLRSCAGDAIGADIDIYGSTLYNSYFPRVSNSSGLFYGVVWQYEWAANDNDVYIALVWNDATTVISAPLITGSTNDTHADIAGSDDRWEYMVTFQRADVNGAKVLMKPFSNFYPDDLVDICNYVFTDCLLPSIEYGGTEFLNTYIIDLGTSATAVNQPSTPVAVQHVFFRSFGAGLIYLPVVRR